MEHIFFLKTGDYHDISIGDSIGTVKNKRENLFHNFSSPEMEIYSDSIFTEFTFIDNRLSLIVLKSFDSGFLSLEFGQLIKEIEAEELVWNFNQELTFDKQLAISILSSSVHLIFNVENGIRLSKAFISG